MNEGERFYRRLNVRNGSIRANSRMTSWDALPVGALIFSDETAIMIEATCLIVSKR
jgi:hypothetical protein